MCVCVCVCVCVKAEEAEKELQELRPRATRTTDSLSAISHENSRYVTESLDCFEEEVSSSEFSGSVKCRTQQSILIFPPPENISQ